MAVLKGRPADSFLARPDPAIKAVLIYGGDAGQVRERASRVVVAVAGSTDDPFNVARLEESTLVADPGRLADEAQALSLMGGRRAVWVREAGAGFLAACQSYLPHAVGEALIVAEAGNLGPDQRLRTWFETAGNAAALPCYVDEGETLDQLIDKALARHALKIDPAARHELARLLGADRILSRSELEKLALYCAGRGRVSSDDVAAVCGDASALQLDDALDATFEGESAITDQQFARLVESGFPPQSVVSAAIGHVSRLQRLRSELDSGKAAEAALRSARPPIFWKRQKSIARQLGLWDQAALRGARAALGQAEVQGRNLPALAEAVTSRALLSLARGARAARQRRS